MQASKGGGAPWVHTRWVRAVCQESVSRFRCQVQTWRRQVLVKSLLLELSVRSTRFLYLS